MDIPDKGPWDALSIPFDIQIDAFVLKFPEQNTLKSLATNEKLARLSNLLKNPEYALHVARFFSPLLVDLCARWLDDDEQDESKFAVFGLLLPAHEQLYPVLSQFLRRPSLANGPLGFVNRENVARIPLKTLQVLLLAYLRLIEACCHLHEEFHWPSSHLQCLFEPPHPDAGIRLLAIRCYAFHVGMNEPARVELEEQLVGSPKNVDPFVDTGFGETVDVWVLPILDSQRVLEEKQLLSETFKYCYGSLKLDMSLLGPRVVHIGGTLLLKQSANTVAITYVQTSSNSNALQQAAALLTRRMPILLSGPSSSGKTSMIEYLCTSLHGTLSNIVTIHLSDTSLDPRSLLGSYVSSGENPGSFEWKDGVLVQALQEGKFLVLENIDKASSEVLGTIWHLVESLSMIKPIGAHAQLNVLGRKIVIAKEGFALFATRTVPVAENGSLSSPTFLGSHKWSRVDLRSCSDDEMVLILLNQCPRLGSPLIKAVIFVWNELNALDENHSSSVARPIHAGDLMKWAARIETTLRNHPSATVDAMDEDVPVNNSISAFVLNPKLREELFLDARDIFFGSVNPASESSKARIDAGMRLLADTLSISLDRTNWLLEKRTAEMELMKGRDGRIAQVSLDRVVLNASNIPLTDQVPVNSRFALHRPSLNLLASLAGCIQANEAVLLTGETGTGKTTVVTYLASLLSQTLVSLNLSHQTESSDLLGGYKPLDARMPAQALQETFTKLFSKTFSREKNVKYEEAIRIAVSGGKWKRAVALWKEAAARAEERIRERTNLEKEESQDAPRKRRKLSEFAGLPVSSEHWEDFKQSVVDFEANHVLGNSKAVFHFVEGPLITALRLGHWVLLDEINLASAETLEAIGSILHDSTGSITLTERGDLEPVVRHSNFRLFTCMNPATDVGKKDLPAHIRSQLTEIYVSPPDANREALLAIVSQYIGQIAMADRAIILDVADFYVAARNLAEGGHIADGANHKPHYSMRTLTRTLTFAVDAEPAFGLRRAVWEGILMAFSTILEPGSTVVLKNLAHKHLLSDAGNVNSILAKIPAAPQDNDRYVPIGPFWLERGPIEPSPVAHYIVTPSVQAKVLDLARILTTRRFPVLIQGPTSSGKTSVIEYLAKRTGHRFVRINNHEHTDIQEYVGSYVTNPKTGLLVFQDGLLVQALRRGDWIVLDELNLAPSDVLEALNRLLDDNRELVIPETGEVVKPHSHFMIFATQNPPGLYGGRKILSRAFRNRFLELHFQDVPQHELKQIIEERCEIAPSYAERIVAVFRDLQTRRQSGRVFETKHGFATLRDLFRWAGRGAGNYQELAEDGYMLIAERARKQEDKVVVKEVIESIMKVRIDELAMYDIRNPRVIESLHCQIPEDPTIVWTFAMRRLFVLLARALRHNEPALLVGETGSGKTSVCELYAGVAKLELRTVNCHQNTETADLLGGQRPLRHRASWLAERLRRVKSLLSASISLSDDDTLESLLAHVNTMLATMTDAKEKSTLQEGVRLLAQPVPLFEWQDGPLVLSMRSSSLFLLDEISLADDSVLERINSVLEPSRTLVLAEKGTWNPEHLEVMANPNFQIAATMNPGGDHGKKELSPALRNRFTEIWVPMINSREDMLSIVRASWRHATLRPFTEAVVDFLHWMTQALKDESSYGLRDLLAWVKFSDEMAEKSELDLSEIFHHSASMVVLDGLASLPQTQGWSSELLSDLKQRAVAMMTSLVVISSKPTTDHIILEADTIAIGPFKIKCGAQPPAPPTFAFQAPTTLENARRVLRACQLNKSILLEGSPGVGKTSLVSALASLSRQLLCRVNLSDQTDLIDLFGSDLPVEGGAAGEFAWKDAEFLQALQCGHWVLLDEMNLAPQSVLEGLNAILDHRGTVFLPELGRSFTKHPDFRLFAAQNPAQQGGGRKGLPKSFLNRFTKVYMEELNPDDLLIISKNLHPGHSEDELRQMIIFNSNVHYEATVRRTVGRQGSPWEFNLRDIMRWLTLCESDNPLELEPGNPTEYMDEIYAQRFRTDADRTNIQTIQRNVFSRPRERDPGVHVSLSAKYVQFGHSLVERKSAWRQPMHLAPLSHAHFKVFEVMAQCINQGWLTILVGQANSGKTTVLRQFAALNGQRVVELSATSATDASDLLGSFEQEQDLSKDHLLISSDQHNPLVGIAINNTSSKLAGATELTSSTGLRHTTGIQERTTLPKPKAKSRFIWVDGPLVRALKDGTWFILDNANLCNPSVLDRLNSLCEPGGMLTLTERGLLDGAPLILRPHPNFKLFMTMDPANGELSRAMRNRGIEIHVTTIGQMSMEPSDRSLTTDADQTCDNLNHLHLRSIQHIVLLLSKFRDLSLDIRLEFLLWRTSQLGNPLFLRLKNLSHCGSVVLAANGLSGDIFDVPSVPGDLLGLPSAFLEAEGAEPLFNANLYARIKKQGALDLLTWSSVRRRLILILWKVTGDLEQEHGPLDEPSVFQISRNLIQGRSFGKEVAPEIKAIYPVLSICRDFLESLVTTVSPAHDVVAAYLPLAELWASACKITQQSALDYTLWRSVLQDLDRILSTLTHSDLRAATSAALHSMRLTSGFVMEKIWAQQKPYSDGQDRVRDMLQELQECTPTKEAEHRRHQVLDLLALMSVEAPQRSSQLGPSERLSVSNEPGDRDLIMQLALLQLPMLRLAVTQGESSCSFLERYCEIALGTVDFPRRSVVSIKSIEWMNKTKCLNGGQIANAFHIWSALLWEIDTENGAKIIAFPSTLLATLRQCNRPTRTIAGSYAYKDNLCRSLHASALECQLPLVSRAELLSTLFFNDLDVASVSVSDSEPDIAQTHTFPSFDSKDTNGEASTVETLKELLKSCGTQLLASKSELERIRAMASGWVYLGLLMIHLYVPNYPLDPEGASIFRRKQLLDTRDQLVAKIELCKCEEALSSGQSTNFMIQDLEEQHSRITVLLQDLPASSGTPRNMSDLQSLFSELLRFHHQLVDVGRTQELLQALMDNDTTAVGREQVNQDSWNRFLERLKTRYISMGDLWYPVDAWMSRVRLGVSLWRHFAVSRPQGNQNASTSFLQALTIFPTIVGFDTMSSNRLVPPPLLDPQEWSTTRIISSISQIKKGDPLERHRESLWMSFEQLFGLWLQIKLRQDAEEAEKNSLYKRRKDVVIVQAEEELEAEEFRRLFPEYDDVLDESGIQTKVGAAHQPLISPYQLFLDLPDLSSSRLFAVAHQPGATLNVAAWAKQIERELHPTLDESSVFFRIRALYKETQRLQQVPSPADGYDFYHHSNVPEVVRAVEIVMALNKRLIALADAWPEQMVLRHLSERCEAIANLDVYSSLARVLSALEQLLLQTDDWQKYANKENGILDFQQSLGNLIIDWRRIELSCWAHLLDSQATLFAQSIGDWWFRMYESIVETSKSVGDNAETDFLREILPLLERFIVSSPLGQFTARLHLLEMFRIFVISIGPGGSDRPLLRRIAGLLSALVDYYRRFTSKVETALTSRRELIDKEVKSFIKLASWKDVNVLALKASAQRTHHQLHRSIRKFRAVLQEPVQELLTQLTEPPSQKQETLPSNTSAPSFVNSVPALYHPQPTEAHLVHLQDTLGVFHSVSYETTIPFLEANATLTEELCGNILSTIDDLQNSIPPSHAANKKSWEKNLLNRKRKAFSDLLKACKEVGLPSQLAARDRASQEDRLWLMERRAVIQQSTETTGQMDSYFDKVLSSLPALQSSLSSHADDVSTRDLTKLLNYAHCLLQYALEARTGVHDLSGFCYEIQSFASSISRASSENGLVSVGPSSQNHLMNYLSLLSYAVSATEEILEAAIEFPHYGQHLHGFEQTFITQIQQHLVIMKERKDIVGALYGHVTQSQLPVLLFDDQKSAEESVLLVEGLCTLLREWQSHDSRVHHLSAALVQSLSQRLEGFDRHSTHSNISGENVSERPIGVMLVIMQRLRALDASSTSKAFLAEGNSRHRRLRAVFDTGHLWRELQSFTSSLQSAPQATTMAQRLCPFLQRFNYLASVFLKSLTSWAKSLFKLASVLVTLGLNLAQNGFCKAKESDEQSSQLDTDMKPEGTGVGEGQGENDISKEIEDQSQVEGLQGQDTTSEQEKSHKEEEKNDTGLEMDDDFEGELESVQQSEDNDSDQEDQEDEEVDEQMNELDPADPDAVDEKMWENKGDKDNQKDDMQNQKEAKDDTGNSQMAAKEEESRKQRQDTNDTERQSENEPSPPRDESEEQNPEDEGPDTDNLPNEAGAQMDNHVREENILDLPEGIDLDLEEETKLPDAEEDSNGTDTEDTPGDDGGKENTGMDEDEQRDESIDEKRETSPGSADAKEDSEPPHLDITAKPDETPGEGQQDTMEEPNGTANVGEKNQDSGDHQMDLEEQTNRPDEQPYDSQPQEPQSGHPESNIQSQKVPDVLGERQDQPSHNDATHPETRKSLADALSEVQRRYEQIQQQSDEPLGQQNGPQPDDVPMEHTEKDEENTRLALAPAGEDEVSKLRDLNIVDEDLSERLQTEDTVMQDQNVPEPAPTMYHGAEIKKMESERLNHVEGAEDALTAESIRRDQQLDLQGNAESLQNVPAPENIDLTGEEVEARLVSWQTSEQRHDGADSIWRLYSSLTHELAWTLCEQLRLILEPTKATRLRGDYRTGKRLNMKKIIPYIASEYTKDKIWLRRTRPSQREYQVLLALDDSRSMSESHAEHLAFQTLALVSRALTRLEAGDVSVVKFGETVQVLHGFSDGPFNDAAGARAIESFSFNQTSTDVLSLVETSLTVLQSARETRGNASSSNADLWQLEIIISDGICSNHDRLRAALRRASEQKVMVVFVIVDALSRSSVPGQANDRALQNSILSMKQVRADLSVERYLDTFPFEYYVVVRNVEALPEVLSGTLKQFFERIAEE